MIVSPLKSSQTLSAERNTLFRFQLLASNLSSGSSDLCQQSNKFSLESPITMMTDSLHDSESDSRPNEGDSQREREREADTKAKQELAQQRAKLTAPWIQEIVPGLFLGHLKTSWNSGLLKSHWIGAMVSLTDRRWAFWDPWTRESGVPESRHKWVQCTDSPTQDLLVYMEDICDFIDQNSPLLDLSSTLPATDAGRITVPLHLSNSRAVFVHSDKGLSRSPTVIVAYLMRRYSATREEALEYVQARRKIEPSAQIMRQLEIWEEVGYKLWEDKEKTIPKAPYQAFLDDRAECLKEKGLRDIESLISTEP